REHNTPGRTMMARTDTRERTGRWKAARSSPLHSYRDTASASCVCVRGADTARVGLVWGAAARQRHSRSSLPGVSECTMTIHAVQLMPRCVRLIVIDKS
ncbi:hypothetical protein J6590_049250, partial [Homalodisca vitripennis]